MNLLYEMSKIAQAQHKAHSENNTGNVGWFSKKTKIRVRCEDKPLLVVGDTTNNVHGVFCVAVLNPDQWAHDRIVCGRFKRGQLKSVLQGHCDAMKYQWYDDQRGCWNEDIYEARRLKDKP